MEVKIGDKVTKKTWCNSDMFITVEWVAPSKDGIWLNFAGTDGEGHKDIWTMNIADLEILPPDLEYEFLEEWEYYLAYGGHGVQLGDNKLDAINVTWKQLTGRKFKKFTDGYLELVEDKA